MGISQQLLTMLLWGATVRSEVPAAHTHKGRNNYSPEEPQGKLAVHRCPAKTSGPQEASTGRQGTVRKANHRGGQANTGEKVLGTEQDVLAGQHGQVSPDQVCGSETQQPSHVISTVKQHSETGIWDGQGKSGDQFCLVYRSAALT